MDKAGPILAPNRSPWASKRGNPVITRAPSEVDRLPLKFISRNVGDATVVGRLKRCIRSLVGTFCDLVPLSAIKLFLRKEILASKEPIYVQTLAAK